MKRSEHDCGGYEPDPTSGYKWIIRWSKEDQCWVGLCAKFPSLSWCAPTELGAYRGIKRIVAHAIRES